MTNEPLRKTRYETMGQDETLSVELPDGIGVVHIRTGNVQDRTGYPVVAAEVISYAIDTPAADGRFYQAEHNSMHETIYLVGHPDAGGDEHIHTYDRLLGSWPSGPDGQTGCLMVCPCGAQTVKEG